VTLRVRFLGSGDSFGSGGRHQTCILVEGGEPSFLLDCGTSALIAMRASGVNPNDIALIVISHLHGDHCGGVPFLLMDAMLGAKRSSKLTVVGPIGMEQHLANLKEALFPGSSRMQPRFEVEYLEVGLCESIAVQGLQVTTFPALHTVETCPMMVRVETHGRTIAYTGDTEWTDEIVTAARNADLLICECYFYDKPVRMHMNYAALSKHRGELAARAMVLTHMSPEMLSRRDQVAETCAFDGMVIEL
jgi:ribonuclease BN (tRNA processing enzyme)